MAEQVEVVGVPEAIAALRGIADGLSTPPGDLAEQAAGVVASHAPIDTGYLLSSVMPIASRSEAIVGVGAPYAPYTLWLGWLDDATVEVEGVAQDAYESEAEQLCRNA